MEDQANPVHGGSEPEVIRIPVPPAAHDWLAVHRGLAGPGPGDAEDSAASREQQRPGTASGRAETRGDPGRALLYSLLPDSGRAAAEDQKQEVPLTHGQTLALAHRAHEALAGSDTEITVFVRRGGSLKVLPAAWRGDALLLQLARIANALRHAGLAVLCTATGLRVSPGPPSSVPSADQARQFLAVRLGGDAEVTSEMIEIAQALIPDINVGPAAPGAASPGTTPLPAPPLSERPRPAGTSAPRRRPHGRQAGQAPGC